MNCTLCPRKCGVDRSTARGYCKMGDTLTAAKAMLHYWEEPCISGEHGSGAVFFSGCVLGCVYCQNYGISTEGKGREITEERLCEIFLELQAMGAHNINLVNPTHFTLQIRRSLEMAKSRGLTVPIVWNTGGYERVETLRTLDGLVDVYLPDVKYCDDALAIKLSNAPHYFETAMAAVAEMVKQTEKPQFNSDSLITRGTIVRHLVIPDCYKDSVEIIRRLGERFGEDILFSLMSQYTPMGKVLTAPGLSRYNRRITTFEYNKALSAVLDAGLQGYMQEKSSAKEEYTPDFNFEGL